MSSASPVICIRIRILFIWKMKTFSPLSEESTLIEKSWRSRLKNPCPKTFLAQRCGDVSADARIEKSDRQTNNHESMTKSRLHYLQMMFHHSSYTFTDFLDFLHLLINTIVVVMTCGCPNLETAQRWQKILVCSAWLLGVGRVSSKRLSNLFAVRRRAEIIPI